MYERLIIEGSLLNLFKGLQNERFFDETKFLIQIQI